MIDRTLQEGGATGAPRFRQQVGWERRWQACLPTANGHPPRAAYADFDNSLLEDMLVYLLRRHSPLDHEGIQQWQRRHNAWVVGEISNGQNLYAHFQEILTGRSLADLIEHLKEAHRLYEGVHDLCSLFAEYGVQVVGVTNAMRPFAEAMMSWHGLNLRFISNDLVFDSDGTFWIEYLDCPQEMILKDRRVREARELGVVPVAAIGDSMADHPMFTEVLASGGFGIVVGNAALAGWAHREIAANRIRSEQIVFVPDSCFNRPVLAAIRLRLERRLERVV